MAIDDLASRKRLTFAQAEGTVPLPEQLNRGEMPRTLRARLWGVLFQSLEGSRRNDGGYYYPSHSWQAILKDEWVNRSGNFPNTFDRSLIKNVARLSQDFTRFKVVELYDFLQFVLRHRLCPQSFPLMLNAILEEERSAYRIVDGDTFVPLGSEEEVAAVGQAFEATLPQEFAGPHSHLRRSAEHLSAGKFADSVRESISAVESTARIIETTADLSKALGRLERDGHIHKAMKHGFLSLYGYTSDEGGIRHALLEDGDAKVDETDAVFMIGACASFVTYLISKKRIAKIETEQGG